MIAVDLALFFLLFVFIMVLFLAFQIASLWLFKNINILYLSASAVLLSIVLVSVASYFFISGNFSSFNTYVLSIAGSGLAAIFASGLYTFLGPATADRSLTTHFFVSFLTTIVQDVGRMKL